MVDIQLRDLYREPNIHFRGAGEIPYAETAPLLGIFPHRNDIHWLRLRFLVSFLVVALISGIVIGIYLLIIQDNSENVLPPIISQLRAENHQQGLIKIKEYSIMEPRSIVIIVQADADQFSDPPSTSNLVDTVQDSEIALPYNFLVLSTGQIIEVLGWENKSSLLPEYTANSVVIGFVGDFTEEAPTDLEVLEVTTFLEDAVRDDHLTLDYIIIGKKINQFPKSLFLELSKLPQWNEKLSDVE